jgi:glycosyltransferase involved in cell wall biosynthesis
MKVSVIIPNYNHAAYLKQRIDSVLHQTYQNFELLLLDDCSKDNSREIIEQYRSNTRVAQIIYNVQNSGSVFSQWQKGIELAKGEWVWIAESDDWCEPTLLENLINGITAKTVIAYCQSIIVKSNGEIGWNSKAEFIEQTQAGLDFVKRNMLLGNAIMNASMCIFKKSCFLNVSDRYLKYKFSGDWLFWVEIAIQGDIFISGKILNYFRKHDKDVSGNAFKSGLSYLEYIYLLNNLSDSNIITNDEKVQLLTVKYKSLLEDKALDILQRGNVISKYNLLLGNKRYKVVMHLKLSKIKQRARRVYSRLLL